MRYLLPLLALTFASCKDEKTVTAPEPSKETSSSAPSGTSPSSSSSSESESPTKSTRQREITPPSKKPLTGNWHPDTKGHVISPYTNESLLAIGVISGGNMTDSEGNEFIVPDFDDSPHPIKPIGQAIPSRPGFIFNPFTNKAVDTRGIPPGSLIRDPNDPDPEHKFRTP